MSLARRIIPCLDTDGARVVKGVRFEALRDAGDPVALATRYDREGADEVVLLDIAAARDRRPTFVETIRRAAQELAIPLTAGGGIRSLGDARAVVEAGADKVTVNTAAVRDPSLITALADAFGSQAVVLAIDARRTPAGSEVCVRGGSEPCRLDAVAWAREGVARGAGEILLTSIDRDGTQSGFDCELVASVADAVPVPVIASGGARTPDDFLRAFEHGRADAALAASVFHDGVLGIGALKNFLAARGVAIRPVT